METDPSTKPAARLIIEKLRMENFKSYFGVQEVGLFHQVDIACVNYVNIFHVIAQRFTAVVGPNGSGKSNVIDAMLFVFGKRAKQIRLDKLSDLIHKSESHRDVQECSVTVFFEDIIDLVWLLFYFIIGFLPSFYFFSRFNAHVSNYLA
jgi:structural maintenance of chromosome 4